MFNVIKCVTVYCTATWPDASVPRAAVQNTSHHSSLCQLALYRQLALTKDTPERWQLHPGCGRTSAGVTLSSVYSQLVSHQQQEHCAATGDAKLAQDSAQELV